MARSVASAQYTRTLRLECRCPSCAKTPEQAKKYTGGETTTQRSLPAWPLAMSDSARQHAKSIQHLLIWAIRVPRQRCRSHQITFTFSGECTDTGYAWIPNHFRLPGRSLKVFELPGTECSTVLCFPDSSFRGHSSRCYHAHRHRKRPDTPVLLLYSTATSINTVYQHIQSAPRNPEVLRPCRQAARVTECRTCESICLKQVNLLETAFSCLGPCGTAKAGPVTKTLALFEYKYIYIYITGLETPICVHR